MSLTNETLFTILTTKFNLPNVDSYELSLASNFVAQDGYSLMMNGETLAGPNIQKFPKCFSNKLVNYYQRSSIFQENFDLVQNGEDGEDGEDGVSEAENRTFHCFKELGYSCLANTTRPTAATEMLSNYTEIDLIMCNDPKEVPKLLNKLRCESAGLINAIAAFPDGVPYRVELTIASLGYRKVRLEQQGNLNFNINQVIANDLRKLRRSALDYTKRRIMNDGIRIKSDLFPRAIFSYCKFFDIFIKPLLDKHLKSISTHLETPPPPLTIGERELVAVVSRLKMFSLNGNQEVIASRSYLNRTMGKIGVPGNVERCHFPFLSRQYCDGLSLRVDTSFLAPNQTLLHWLNVKVRYDFVNLYLSLIMDSVHIHNRDNFIAVSRRFIEGFFLEDIQSLIVKSFERKKIHYTPTTSPDGSFPLFKGLNNPNQTSITFEQTVNKPWSAFKSYVIDVDARIKVFFSKGSLSPMAIKFLLGFTIPQCEETNVDLFKIAWDLSFYPTYFPKPTKVQSWLKIGKFTACVNVLATPLTVFNTANIEDLPDGISYENVVPDVDDCLSVITVPNP